MTVDLTGIAEKGYIGLWIKAEDTPENVAIHKAFREVAKDDYKNDYTLFLRELLKMYGDDYRYELLYGDLVEIRERVSKLEQPVDKPVVVKDDGLFG